MEPEQSWTIEQDLSTSSLSTEMSGFHHLIPRELASIDGSALRFQVSIKKQREIKDIEQRGIKNKLCFLTEEILSHCRSSRTFNPEFGVYTFVH